MHEALESADEMLGGLKSQACEVERCLEVMEASLAKLDCVAAQAHRSGDHEVATALQKTLAQKQADCEQAEVSRKQLARALAEVGGQLAQVNAQNINTAQELEQLEALGEDVEAGRAVLEQRRSQLQQLEQRCQQLLARLGQTAGQLSQEASSQWPLPGLIEIPIADLPDPEVVSSPAHFHHHISWDSIVSAINQLPQIQQEIAAGKTADDLSREDGAVGLDWAHGRRRVYDLFYDPKDCVALERTGTQYRIIAGRHPVYAAKALDLKSIPVRLL